MKIIKIKSCKECPNKLYALNFIGKERYICNIFDKIIENIEIIPSWCPLEDYKEK